MATTRNRRTRTSRTRTSGIRTAVAATAVAALGLTGCTAAAPASSASASPSASTVAIPDSALGQATQWALDALGAAGPVTATEIEERFSATMIEQLGSVDALIDSFSQLQAMAPWTPLAYEEQGSSAVTRLESGGAPYTLRVTLDDVGLLTELLVQSAPEAPEPAGSWDELTERADALGAPVGVSVFDVSDGAVEAPTFTAGDPTGPQPSGSMIKLFVLLAVADAVDAGTLAWDETLTLTDAVRSLPSGELQLQPDGTEVTVQDAAAAMISISDNTATDLLIQAVGADAVEAQLAEHAPDGADASTPLLTTRALFQIGWGDDSLRAQWAAGDDAARTALLEQVAAGPLTTVATDVTVPVWQDDLDWFLSASDLARVHLALHEASQTDAGAPLAEILTANPGLDMGEGWDVVAFKGGSSIGVLGGSWLVDGDAGTYVVVVQSATTDEAQLVAQQSALYLATDAGTLLADD